MNYAETKRRRQQALFDRVLTHLRLQGQRAMSVDEDGKERCVYRTEDGLMCAVGCLIPDEAYVPQMEVHHPDNVSAGWDFRGVLGAIPGAVPVEDDTLMDGLQQFHDAHWHPHEDLMSDHNHRCLVSLAEYHGLTIGRPTLPELRWNRAEEVVS